jgi:hypothetical protein
MFLVMKGKGAHLAKTKHEEHKLIGSEGSKREILGNSGNENNFYSSSSVPFKVEEKLEIPMFNGKTNVEVLDSWLKQLKFTLSLSNPRNTIDILFPFEDDQTCSVVVGDLCGCIEDRKESHGDERGGLQDINKVTIISHRLRRGTNHGV